MTQHLMECTQILKHRKRILQEQYHVESLAIFGSVARHQHHHSSDIDILVRFSMLPSFFELAHMEDFLRKEFKGQRMRVDLIIENGADKSFLDRIAKDLIHI